MPTKVVPRGVMQDFKKALLEIKRQGRLDRSVQAVRQQVYMHIATRFGPRFMQVNGSKVTEELNEVIKEVQGG